MTLDPLYVTTADLEEYFVSKDTAEALANGTLTFYRDSARTVKKDIYQLSGAPPNYTYTVLPNPITLSTAGTVQNASGDNVVIYYKPYVFDIGQNKDVLDLYYIVCQDVNGVEQFTREAWPNIADQSTQLEEDKTRENQISNPTFTNVFINEGITTTYTATGLNQEFIVAPNWTLVLSGAGDVVVQRVAITGNDKVPSSPPYSLDIQVGAGISNCYLRQRFSFNSGLWASTPTKALYLAGSFVARSESGASSDVDMYYQESSGNPALLILNGTVTSSYTFIKADGVLMPQSINTNSGKNGYVDIYISIQSGSHIRITAIQAIPSVTSAIKNVPLDLNSSNRDESFQGDYYIPRLNAKTQSSFLTGWDFPLNPKQFGTTGSITSTSKYIVDQTIAATAPAGILTFNVESATQGINFVIGNTNAFYILQYLSDPEVKKLIGSRLAVNVFAFANAGTVIMRVYLYRSGSTGAFPTSATGQSIGDVAIDGTFTLDPTRGANWTEIGRSGLSTAQSTFNQFTFATIASDDNNYGFSGWEITDQILNTNKFAIVVTFAYTNATSAIVVNSVSLVPGDIPCRPALQTNDEVFRECKYYYQKSFLKEQIPITNAGRNSGESYSVLVVNSSVALAPIVCPIVNFLVPMRKTPTVVLYNPESNNSEIRDLTANGSAGLDLTLSNATNITGNGFYTLGTTVSNQFLPGDVLAVHWTADARLGVV